MSVLVPFRALRPPRESIKEVAAYPYDVLDWEEAKKIGERQPRSFLHIEKSEIDLPPDFPPGDERIFAAARSNLERWIKEGILLQEKRACFYVYGQRKGNHVQYGMVGGVRLADYEAGRVKRHELTTVDKEKERIRNIDATHANTGLVFMVYRSQEAINRIVDEIVKEEPEYDFVFDNGVAHTVWTVGEEKRIETLKRHFLNVEALYIADGHHRVAAASFSGSASSTVRCSVLKSTSASAAHNRVSVSICQR